MRKLSLWLRAHPVVGDGAIALFMALLYVADVLTHRHSEPAVFWLLVPGGVLLTVPLAVRRVWPVHSAVAVLLGVVLLTIAREPTMVGNLAPNVMVYTLVVCTSRRIAVPYAALFAVLFLVPLLTGQEPTDDVGQLLLERITFLVMLTGFCYLLGEFVGARRAYLAEVERRLRAVEFERDQQARIAVAEERNRIAREIHDVLAHSVSVMVTQADGAGYALRTKPELAERALQTISSTGREALHELRGLLGVLRGSDDEPDRIPQPTAADLHGLVERVRALGVTATVELVGDFGELPTGIGLSVYRIVQESLTNVVKHGGPGAEAAVRVANDGERVEIEVVDSGAAAPSGLASGGNGLIGMRERAVGYGGSLEAGPRPGGGWRVHAVLPLALPDEDRA